MLFEERMRDRIEPLRRGERLFDFYNARIAPGYDEYRSSVNRWLGAMAEQDRNELSHRLRQAGEVEFHAAMAELITHAILNSRGYSVECHPEQFHAQKRPDFLAKSQAGNPLAVVEVTSFGPSQERRAIGNVEDSIYNALDNLDIPRNFFLGFNVLERARGTPSLNALCRAVQNWIAVSVADNPNYEGSEIFCDGGWAIEIDLFAVNRVREGDGGIIGVVEGEARILSGEQKIRLALENKARRYGEFELPYIIVVTDCNDELTGGDENCRTLVDAVLGDEVWSVGELPSGEYIERATRLRNGFYGNPDRPRSRNVSAALLLPTANIWQLRDPRWQPILFENPYANNPLAENFLPVSRCYINAAGQLCFGSGNNLADLVGLPAKWPPSG